ncbi:MAG TPA: TonB-dependent siderophore receptor [Alphaproteobacteria bacterium]|jgi:catecholate siderophore receptor
MSEDHRKNLRQQNRRLGLVSHSVIAFTAFGIATAVGSASSRAEDAGQVAQQSVQQDAPVALPNVNVESVAPEDTYKRDILSSPKYTEPVLDTPKSITIIPKELMEERGASSLMDVLRTVPGISLGAGEGGVTAGDRTFIRGFDSRGDTFVDGTRDAGVTIRDAFNYEQVEVTKGPGSAVGGRGSTGGSINLVSKAPQAETFHTGSLTLGTDMTKRGTVDWNEKLDDNTAFRLNVMGQDGEVAGRDAIEQSRFGIAPSITFGMAGTTQLTLSYFHLETDGIVDYGIPFDPATGRPASVDRNNFYGLKSRDKQETAADIATVKLDHQFNDMFSIRNQTRYGATSNNYIATSPNLTGAPPGQVLRSTKSRDENSDILSNQTDLTSKFSTAGIDHTLVTGLELSREDFDNQGRTFGALPNASLSDPDYNQPFTNSITFNGNNTNSTTDTIALYAFDTIKLNEQWEVSGGIRVDKLDTNVRTGAPAVDLGREDTLTSYQGGIVYKPAKNGSIYVSYGTSFNPSAEFGSVTVDTADLAPEKNKSYEVGTKWDFLNERLSTTAAIFRTDKTNARVTDSFGDTVLEGETRVDGFEIGLSGTITPDWKVFGGYTYLKSEIVDDGPAAANDGNKVPGVAPNNFSLWTTYQFTPKWMVGGGALYTGKRYGNATNERYVEDYWRFDAMAAYQLTETVDLRLNILNLTDATYFDGPQSEKAIIAPGRTALITADVKF